MHRVNGKNTCQLVTQDHGEDVLKVARRLVRFYDGYPMKKKQLLLTDHKEFPANRLQGRIHGDMRRVCLGGAVTQFCYL